MPDIASCGDIIEPHLLTPDKSLHRTVGLENMSVGHGKIFSYHVTPQKYLW